MKNFTRLLWMFVLLACEGEGAFHQRETPEYLPLTRGVYQIYDVQARNYYGSAPVQDLQYQLKAEVTDSFPSGDTYTYVIHRSTRTGEQESWQPLDTWSVRSAGREFVVSEGNTPYLKLELPYTADHRWDGNAYNTLGVDEYRYSAIGLPQDVNGISFENTVEVQQEFNDDPIVYRDERKEIYAAGVGLVYKEVIQLHYCTEDACLGQQKINEGTEMKMVIRQYGKM